MSVFKIKLVKSLAERAQRQSWSKLKKTNPKEQRAMWTFSFLVDLNSFSNWRLWALRSFQSKLFYNSMTLWPSFQLAKLFFSGLPSSMICVLALSNAEISSVLLSLWSCGLHESSLTLNECDYWHNINQGKNSKGSLEFSKKLSERELKWRQHSLTARMMSGFLLESASICNFAWHMTSLLHSLSCCRLTCIWWQDGATFSNWYGHKFCSPNDEWKVRHIDHLQQLPKFLSKNNVDFT